MPRFRLLLRVGCALLVVSGLGVSLLEEAQCREADGDRAAQVTSPGRAALAGTTLPSKAPIPAGGECCLCIHTYPATITAAASPAPTVVGYATTYPPPLHAPRDRHPQPLVPPPIA